MKKCKVFNCKNPAHYFTISDKDNKKLYYCKFHGDNVKMEQANIKRKAIIDNKIDNLLLLKLYKIGDKDD